MSGCGWIWPPDYDNDGESVENDLLEAGVTHGQYDSISLLWAHNGALGRNIPACYGGLATFHGWYWDEIGHTGFNTNALFFSGEGLWNPFHHEFQHTIDGMLALGGEYAYFHADQPQYANGRFGDNYDFHAVQMRDWPIEKWFAILETWGNYHQIEDADGDGVPDSGDHLFATEESLGSSPDMIDSDNDAANDLVEGMAGRFRGSNPLVQDSDGDGQIDGYDDYILYPTPLKIDKKTMPLDGATVRWDFVYRHPMGYQCRF